MLTRQAGHDQFRAAVSKILVVKTGTQLVSQIDTEKMFLGYTARLYLPTITQLFKQGHNKVRGNHIDRVQRHRIVVYCFQSMLIESGNRFDHVLAVLTPDIGVLAVIHRGLVKDIACNLTDGHALRKSIKNILDKLDILLAVEPVPFGCTQWFYQAVPSLPGTQGNGIDTGYF